MIDCFIALGSNLGKRKNNIKTAIAMLEESSEITIVSESGIYESKPMYNPNLKDFYNSVVRIKTSFAPFELLRYAQLVEKKLGRVRQKERYSNRTIDIDILSYGDEMIDSDELTLPHPHIKERKFVLKPWSDIDSDYVLARSNKKIEELLNESEDNSTLLRVNK